MIILFFNISDNLEMINKTTISTKYSSDKRNLEYSVGRFLINLGAEKFFNIKNPEIDESQQKPRIKNDEFYFSISHSLDYICVAFSDQEIGFDIEKIREKNYKKIAKRMNFNCNTLEDFFKLWTEFEAKYKSRINKSKNFKINDYMCAVSANKIEEIKKYNVKLTKSNFDFLTELFDNVIIEKLI